MSRLKKSVRDLAYFGGEPAFGRQLHVGAPNIGDRSRLLERLESMLDRRWLSNGGPLVLEFEDWLAASTGAAHAVATCNATLALQLVARALDLRGEVIMPSFTFVATAHALEWTGLTPVFCDIDPESATLDPAAVENLITPRTSAILGVHLWGEACATSRLQKIADKHQIALFYDAAHALGCASEDGPIGRFGAAEVFSFHATKFLNSFEGGAVTTDDPALADRLRALRAFGQGPDGFVAGPGINAKMTEAAAAMGLTSAEAMPEIVAANAANHAHYLSALSDIDGITVRRPDNPSTHNHQYVVIEVDAAEAGVDRDALLLLLQAENVLAKRYFWPACHQLEPYRSAPRVHTPLPLPVTEDMSRRVLALPTGCAVTPADIEAVGSILRLAGEAGPRMVGACDPRI